MRLRYSEQTDLDRAANIRVRVAYPLTPDRQVCSELLIVQALDRAGCGGLIKRSWYGGVT